ncbi:MAG: cytochrome c biogenesis protein CcsA [Cyclobacteriaceae bacterium]
MKVSTALKITCILLLVYVYAAGFLIEVPRRAILNETIRNLFFHVPMWFTMITLQAISLYYSIRFLRKKKVEDDIKSYNHVTVSIFFGLLGFVTGMFWAKFTWGEWVVNDPKIIGSFIALLIYLPFLLLRKFIPEKEQRAVISAVYNIFAFTMGFILIFVIPRLTDSLHPGNGGNPGLNMYDVDNTLRMVFYPAVIGWILLGRWITKLKIGVDYLIAKKNEELD